MDIDMSHLYKVFFNSADDLGVAYSDNADELIFLPDTGSVESWNEIELTLSDGGFADYLANDIGGRLCSDRLNDILAAHASAKDKIQWLKVHVNSEEEHRTYHLLHFPDPPDVINKQESILADHFVVKPVLSKQAVSGHSVFSYVNAGSLPLFVTDSVRDAILKSSCTGIEFSRAPVR
jgi:hypothetical protein